MGNEINRDKRQPNYTSAVHGEPDVFGFVEILGYFASFESVYCTKNNQDYVISLGYHERHIGDAACEHCNQSIRMLFGRSREFDEEPSDAAHQLNADESC